MTETTSEGVECPICGEGFDPTAAGGWCTNPDCGEWQYLGDEVPEASETGTPDDIAEAVDPAAAEDTGTADGGGAETPDSSDDDDELTLEFGKAPGAASADEDAAAGDESDSATAAGAESTESELDEGDGTAGSLAEEPEPSASDVAEEEPLEPDVAEEEPSEPDVAEEEPLEPDVAEGESEPLEPDVAEGESEPLEPDVAEEVESDVAEPSEPAETDGTTCPACGADVGAEDAFCASCGEDLTAPSGTTPERLALSARGEEVVVAPDQTIGREIRRIVTETGGDEDEAVRIHREHVRFVRENGRFYVVDLGDNPTELSGSRLAKGDREPVEPGDELTLSGVVTLSIEPA